MQRNINVVQRVFHFADVYICKKPLPMHLLRDILQWIKEEPLSMFDQSKKSLFLPIPKNYEPSYNPALFKSYTNANTNTKSYQTITTDVATTEIQSDDEHDIIMDCQSQSTSSTFTASQSSCSSTLTTSSVPAGVHKLSPSLV